MVPLGGVETLEAGPSVRKLRHQGVTRKSLLAHQALPVWLCFLPARRLAAVLHDALPIMAVCLATDPKTSKPDDHALKLLKLPPK